MDDLKDCKYDCDDDLHLERLEGFGQLVRFILCLLRALIRSGFHQEVEFLNRYSCY